MTGFDLLKKHVVGCDICCGCGGCVACCPAKAITVKFTTMGVYQPHLISDCSNCGRCVKACPFSPDSLGTDELGNFLFGKQEAMQHRPETGYFHRCFVGSSPVEKIRWDGASGGLLTWLLCELLKRGEVDFVVTAAPNADPRKLFRYVVLNRVDAVKNCSKSVYYPLELSEVLNTISTQEGKYVVVGLPCMLKALRHAQGLSPTIKRRVVLALGLVCGKNKSRLFTDVLAHMAEINPAEMREVCYRDKRGSIRASDFSFSAQDNRSEKYLLWSKGWGRIFTQSWFDLGPCRICDDIFAESADAAFMDAWLPEYVTETKGTNLILSRNEQLSKILAEIALDIPVEKLIASQWGVIQRKRKFLDWELKQIGSGTGRSHLALSPGWRRYLPNNWVSWHLKVQERMMAIQVCATSTEQSDWFSIFQSVFSAWQPKVQKYRFLARILNLPSGIIRRVSKLIIN